MIRHLQEYLKNTKSDKFLQKESCLHVRWVVYGTPKSGLWYRGGNV
jgi:hypothetical protein